MHMATDETGDYDEPRDRRRSVDAEGLTETTAYRIENEDPMNELDSLEGSSDDSKG